MNIMEFQDLLNLVLGLFGVLGIIISFVNKEYQILALVFGSLAIILVTLTLYISNSLIEINKKVELQKEVIQKVEEKLKIYDHIIDIKSRLNSLENRRK